MCTLLFDKCYAMYELKCFTKNFITRYFYENHLAGHYMLTKLLLDYIVTTGNICGDCRIINLTCAAHNHLEGVSMRGKGCAAVWWPKWKALCIMSSQQYGCHVCNMLVMG